MSVWDSTSIRHWRRPARTLLRGRTESPIRSRRAILPAAPGAFALPVQRRLRCAAARLSRVVGVTPASGSLEQLARQHAVLRRLATLVASEPPPDEVFTAVAREAGLLLGAQRGTRGRAHRLLARRTGWPLSPNWWPMRFRTLRPETSSQPRAPDSSKPRTRRDVRIERDLHDGAQQRLVVTALELSMLERKLDHDSRAARTMLAKARAARRAVDARAILGVSAIVHSTRPGAIRLPRRASLRDHSRTDPRTGEPSRAGRPRQSSS
jgi:hypothetical protein